jgi:aspartyl-tRNA(Asn)/glutamyl-tRNA(Gln) amidotransferase subunit B
MCERGVSADEIIAESDVAPLDDMAQATAWAEEILTSHPAELQRYRDGEGKILEYFVGQLMRASGGRLDPRKAREVLARLAGSA